MVLPEAEFRRWVIAPTQRLVGLVRERANPEIPVIGFPRGAGLYESYFCETGVDALGLRRDRAARGRA